MDLATIGFRATTTDLDTAEKKLDKLGRTSTKTEKKVSKSNDNMSASFTKLAAVFGTVIASLQSMSKILDVTREFDVLNAQLITATGSAENAALAFSAIAEFAEKTPYDLAQSVKGFQQLVNLGLTPSEQALMAYGNTASAMGKDLSQMVEAVADAATGEFERLKEFGIKSKKEGDSIKFTFQGVTTSIKNNSADIEKYLINIGETNFAGAMAQRMDTLDGKISNLSDSFDMLALNVSKNGVGQAMEGAVETAIYYVNQLNTALISGAIGGYFTAVSNSWASSFGDIATNFNSMINALIKDFARLGITGSGITKQLRDAFFQFPANIKAAIELATTELWAFIQDAKVFGSAIADAINPFSGKSFDDIRLDAERQFGEINRIVSQSYKDIETERDASITSIESEIAAVNTLKTSYESQLAASKAANYGTDRLAEFKIKPEDVSAAQKIESPVSGWNEDLKNFSNGVGDAFKSIQGLSKNGSKEYKKLGVAVSALNALQAVSAVLNQGKGDPYTALGRMAAMAAAVASLGVSIGGLSGSLGDESAENQANQGLNIWGEKSESISNSIDITASATEKLVGINTSMLQALRSVQTGISNASALIARNNVAAQVDIGSLGISGNVFSPIFDNIIGDFLSFTTGGLFTKTIGKFLGGSSKVVDEGIRIIGGSLGDLIDDVTVQAFQTVKYKKWKFGSTKRKTQYEDISDEVGNQVSLVFDSIADSVYLGATALGMSGDAVTKAINDFEVATIQISLKGLSAEDQQKEINAVFSKLFDNLASDVIDFLPDFQQVGEGLGETLSRLAAEVQVADLITSRFGTTFGDKMADPEAYAAAADNLAELVGGVDKLAEATANFTESFATDAQKLEIQQRELSEAFNEAGLTLPTTTQGMWDLMQSLDGTTEQGREQIALLLELSGASSSYLNLLEKVSSRYTDAIDAMYKSSNAVKQIGLDAALAAARLGDMSLAEALDLGALNPSQSDFGSFADFAYEQAITANKLQELADLSKSGVSDAQKQIDLLDQIADNTSKESSESQTVKVDTAALNDEIKMMRAESKTANTNQAKTNAELTRKISRLVSIEETRLLDGV